MCVLLMVCLPFVRKDTNLMCFFMHSLSFEFEAFSNIFKLKCKGILALLHGNPSKKCSIFIISPRLPRCTNFFTGN